MKKITFLLAIFSIIVLFDTTLSAESIQYKRNQAIIQSKSVIKQKPMAYGPDFLIKNVKYNTSLRCNDPLLTIYSEVWNIGNMDYHPNPKTAILYCDIADAITNKPIYFGGRLLDRVIPKGSYRKIIFNFDYSDIMYKDQLKKSRTIKIALVADEQGEITELNEMNNIYRGDKNIINRCRSFNLPYLKKDLEINNEEIIVPKVLANITRIVNNPTMDLQGPDAELEIRGNFFGNNQGNKGIRMGAYTIENTGVWNHNLIVLVVPASLNIPYGRTYNIYLVDENGNRISNIYKFLLRMYIDGADPPAGFPGSKMVIHGYQFGATQGANQVILGPRKAQIVKWEDSKITVRVPALAPGTYDIYLKRHKLIISNKRSFTVN